MEGHLIKEKNLQMVKDLVIKKIYNQTGVIFKKNEPFFKNNFNVIIMTILENEIDNFRNFPVEKAVLKLNTIFILECVEFFIGSLRKDETEEFSSKIDELPEELEEPQQIQPSTPLQRIPQPQPLPPPPQIQQPLPTPEPFPKEILFFEQNETNEYLLNFEKIEKLRLEMFTFDFSDYIVNEHNNSFYIDTELIKVPIGNYTAETLHMKIKGYFEYDSISECFIPLQPVNFDLKNSIGPLLGFDCKTYKTRGNKHNICHPKYVNLKINYGEIMKNYKIFLNVAYNEPVFFTTDTDIKMDSIKKISVELGHNTRGRRYCFKLVVN